MAAFRRSDTAKDANDAARDAFQDAIIEIFGGNDKVPQAVQDAMKLDDYGKGKPLTARRINAVKDAINKTVEDDIKAQAKSGELTALALAEERSTVAINKLLAGGKVQLTQTAAVNLGMLLVYAVSGELDDAMVRNAKGELDATYANKIVLAKMRGVLDMLSKAGFDFNKHLAGKAHLRNTMLMLFDKDGKPDAGRLATKLASFDEKTLAANAKMLEGCVIGQPCKTSLATFRSAVRRAKHFEVFKRLDREIEKAFRDNPALFPPEIAGDDKAKSSYVEYCKAIAGKDSAKEEESFMDGDGSVKTDALKALDAAGAATKKLRAAAGGDRELAFLLLKDMKTLMVAGDGSLRSVASVLDKRAKPLKQNLAELRELEKEFPGALKAGLSSIDGNSGKAFNPGVFKKLAAAAKEMPFAQLAAAGAGAQPAAIVKLLLACEKTLGRFISEKDVQDKHSRDEQNAMCSFCVAVAVGRLDGKTKKQLFATLSSPAGSAASNAMSSLAGGENVNFLNKMFGAKTAGGRIAVAASAQQYYVFAGLALCDALGKDAAATEAFLDSPVVAFDKLPAGTVDAIFEGVAPVKPEAAK